MMESFQSIPHPQVVIFSPVRVSVCFCFVWIAEDDSQQMLKAEPNPTFVHPLEFSMPVNSDVTSS